MSKIEKDGQYVFDFYTPNESIEPKIEDNQIVSDIEELFKKVELLIKCYRKTHDKEK
jgi:hypothetical protein